MSNNNQDFGDFSLPDDYQNSEAEGDSGSDDEDIFMNESSDDEMNDHFQPEDDPLSGTPESNIEFEWCSDTSYFENLKLFFDEKPTVNVEGKEIDLFNTVFSDDMLDRVVEETNIYAIQKESKNWTPTTRAEIEAFIGIIILMGIRKLPSTDHYWSSDPALRVDIIAETMTVKRFKKLIENIHMNDNTTEVPKSNPKSDKLHKIRPIVDMLNSNFGNTNIYKPSSFVSVDESMVKFKGRSVMKQYMPLKPIKRGYKIWCICDAKTGFVLKFRVYTGQCNSADDLSLGEKVVLDLTTNVRAGSLVVFDNFFTSVPLMEKLDERKLYSCGTVRSNRKYLPDFIKGEPKSKTGKSKRQSMKRGQYQFKTKGHVAATKWMDRKCDQLGFRLRLARQLINGFKSRKRTGRPVNFTNKRKHVPDEVRYTQVGIHMPEEMPKPRRCKRCSTKKHDKRTRMLCTHCKVPLCLVCFAEFHKKDFK